MDVYNRFSVKWRLHAADLGPPQLPGASTSLHIVHRICIAKKHVYKFTLSLSVSLYLCLALCVKSGFHIG